MTINIKVGNETPEDHSNPKISLNLRKSVDGNVIIYDHNDIDIVIKPAENKVITFPKSTINDGVYAAQHDLFHFLNKKGVIKNETIRGANVYAAIEAEYPTEGINGINPFQAVLFSIGKWIEKERPKMEFEASYREEFEKNLLEPEDDESTELGEVEQAEKKGSVPSSFPRYMYEIYNK